MTLLRLTLSIVFLLGNSDSAVAGYKDDIGYTRLVTEQGASLSDGSGVTVTHAEASTAGQGNPPVFLPDPGIQELSSKNIIDQSGSTTGTFSGHASSVGKLFYGDQSSIAPGISTISAYLADDWLEADFLRFGDVQKPLSSVDRIANHSWVGSTGEQAYDSDMLRRTDWLVEHDEFIQFVGVRNNSIANKSLLSGAYNVIAVGKSDGVNGFGTSQLDADYVSGRTRPEIVAPKSTSSSATPVAAAAAAMLIGVGHNTPSLSTDPEITSTSNRAGSTIYNAERSEVIKAAFMAGADRATTNSSSADITDYRALQANQTSNGLDKRFGAGQLNVYNSFHIVAAGEQNNDEDDGAGGGLIGSSGFDYEPSFGGSGVSNATASYYFSTSSDHAALSVTLAWNIGIDGGNGNNFSGIATLHNLDLYLYDVTGGAQVLVQDSSSTVDNTETIWTILDPDKDYMLQVEGQGSFDWDFAIAWQLTNLPDTDGDGVPDVEDTDDDNDGLLDGDELTQHDTDPLLADTDGDGFDDAMELAYGSDPTADGSGSTPAENINNNGDFNGDSLVNVGDMLLATRIVLGELQPTPGQLVRADMVPDEVIDSRDLLRIQQLVLGF